MTKSPYAIPLRPDYGATTSGLATSIAKAVQAMGAAAFAGHHASDAITDDPVARSIITNKGAVVPSSTSTVTALRQNAIQTLAAVMGPTSTIRQLFPKMINVTLEGLYGVILPSILTDPDAVSFVAEGSPIPVRAGSFDTGVTLVSRKIATICTMTRELFEYTAGYAVILDLMQRNFSRGFEKYLFSTDAAGVAPAGLLYNITPEDPTTGTTEAPITAIEAMVTDLSVLAAKVLTVSNDPHFIAGPKAFAKIVLRQPLLKFPLLVSNALDDATVVCLSPSCIAISGGTDPVRLDVSNQAVLHMENTTPLPLTTAATASFPIRDLFSTDVLAVRLRADCDFALRSSSAIAVVNDITW
jgi:Phage capsid family